MPTRCLKIVFSCALRKTDKERRKEREKENQGIILCSEYWFMFIGNVRVAAYRDNEIVSNRSSSLIILGTNINSTISFCEYVATASIGNLIGYGHKLANY